MGERVIIRVDFTTADALGQTGWRRVAIEIDNQAGQDQPALVAAAAAFYGVPASQVRAEPQAAPQPVPVTTVPASRDAVFAGQPARFEF